MFSGSFFVLQIRWICVLLVILSSSTAVRRRFPRPTLVRSLHEDQCSSVVRIDCLDRQVRRERIRSRLPVCVQLTDDQLLQKLKDVGGYNPIYVAINKTEAKKFKDPRTFEPERPKVPNTTRAPDCKNKPTPPPTQAPWNRTTRRPPLNRFRSRPRPADVNEDDMESMTPVEKLHEKLKDLGEDEINRVRRRVRRNSNVESCWARGTTVNGSRKSRINLCSECRLVTQLAGDEVPQFINEVACGHDLPAQSGQPSHDNQCYASTGLCTQRILRFPALKRTGYVRNDALSAAKGMEIYVEQWVTSTKDIRAGCKCEMFIEHARLLKSIASFN